MLDLYFFRSVTGSKSFVHTHLKFLVIVFPPFIPCASSASTTVRNFACMTDLPAGSNITEFTVFDLENKLVAYSGTFEAGVREVVSQISYWRMMGEYVSVSYFYISIFLTGHDVLVSCLEERPPLIYCIVNCYTSYPSSLRSTSSSSFLTNIHSALRSNCPAEDLIQADPSMDCPI
jgi:hypothetical protein